MTRGVPALIAPADRCSACGWPGSMMLARRPCLAALGRGESSGIDRCLTEADMQDAKPRFYAEGMVAIAAEQLRCEGRWAREDGRSLAVAPYAADSMAYVKFAEGWQQRDEQYRLADRGRP